jgi:uncharacterized protein (TIGR03435 family)
MKPSKKTLNQTLDRWLSQSPCPAFEDMQSSLGHVWERLQPQIVGMREEVIPTSTGVRLHWPWSKTVLVAAMTAAVVLVALPMVLIRTLRPDTTAAIVQTVGSGLSRTDGKKSQALHAGLHLTFGQTIRSSVGDAAVVALSDGSNIEMRPNSELALESTSDGVRIRLNRGSVIVVAAKQRTGHLYVQTKDLKVSVVGTVFLVNAEEAGSRVAVFQGEVTVQGDAGSRKLSPGEQVATNPLMKSHPVSEQISWSGSAAAHLALLSQSTSAASPRLKFDAAAIRPVRSAGVFIKTADRLRCKGADGILTTSVIRFNQMIASVVSEVPQGRCVGRNVDPISLIALAYDIPLNQRISGVPIPEELYDIETEAMDLSTVTKEQLRQMLQTLLLERFAIKVHRETREGDGFLLTVGKNGPNYGPAFMETSGEEEYFGPMHDASGKAVVKGKFRLKTFAESLGLLDNLSGPVLDMTNLSGIYNLTLILKDASSGSRGTPNAERFDPPASKVIGEQLGLRLERAKVPVEYLVVDHFEKASEN